MLPTQIHLISIHYTIFMHLELYIYFPIQGSSSRSIWGDALYKRKLPRNLEKDSFKEYFSNYKFETIDESETDNSTSRIEDQENVIPATVGNERVLPLGAQSLPKNIASNDRVEIKNDGARFDAEIRFERDQILLQFGELDIDHSELKDDDSAMKVSVVLFIQHCCVYLFCFYTLFRPFAAL